MKAVKRPLVIPPQIAFVALVLGSLFHALAPVTWRILPAVPAIGIFVFVVGVFLAVWAALLFRSKRTPIYATTLPETLVTSGPFRFTRNPIYLGLLLTLLSFVFLFGSLPMLVAPLFFLLVMNFYYLPFEESKLETTFGESYTKYRQRVRRWL
jgi:protein-S-isoprenylcysteine O-methyltransferase Ste14